MKPQWPCFGISRLPWSVLAFTVFLTAPAYGADEQGAPAAGPQQAASAAPAMTESQTEAASLLKAMTEYLAGLKSFSVAFRSGYDVVQPSGQKIEFGESRRVSLARPDRLRVEEIASDGKRDLAIFDGGNISVLDADSNVFAQVPQPGSLDESLVYFVRQLRMRMPLALLLTTRLPEALTGRVKTLDLVESTEILGIPAHHIAGRTDSVDFQFWIRDGKQPLPMRVVITYKESPGQPQYWASFADWNTSPQFAKTTFEFTPPSGATKVPFAVQVRRSNAAPQPPAANEEGRP